MEPMIAPAVEITISEAYSRTRSLMRCLIAMSAKKLAGVTPTAFVTAALTGEIPVASKTGKEITDAPPAIPLITPTSKPTAAMAMNSSICQPYTRYMAFVQVRLFAVARAKAGTELISCEPGSLASIIESLKAHGELANVFISRVDGDLKGSPIKKGDLLKAATWKAPAKHARGNIIDGTARYGVYGPDYL